MIELKNLKKRYAVGHGKPDVEALKGISLKLPDTGMVFVLGKSGSGKSTFLNVVGGLDSFEEGDLILFGKSAREFSDSDYDSYRNKYVGFIFQEYNIINSFTVRRNVELAVELQNRTADKGEVDEILSRVGLLELADRLPSQLSGGQKQRIAIARALVKHPQIVLADEPTGALDSFNTKEIFQLLTEISKDRLVVCVTHDAACAEKYADRIIRIKEGRVIADLTRRSDAGAPVKGSTDMVQLGTGLVRIDNPQEMSQGDLEAIKGLTKDSEGPGYFAYGDHVRIPAELAEGDDSEDIPVGFTPTMEEDIQARTTKNRQFKYIKSHMMAKTMATFALGTMKHSPVRLAMTIILSLLSFTMLGVSVAISTYDEADTFAESASIYKPAASVLTKTVSGEDQPDQQGVFLPEDIERIRDGFSSSALPVYSTPRLSLEKNMTTKEYDGSDWFPASGFKIAPLDSSIDLDRYEFSLEGNLPGEGEVVLPDNALWVLKRSGATLGDVTFAQGQEINAQDVIGKPIHLVSLSSVTDDEYVISGILHTDLSEDQIAAGFPGANDQEVTEATLMRQNWTNGPSKMMFFNPDEIASDTFQTTFRVGSIQSVLVPTPGESALRDLWHFTTDVYDATDEDRHPNSAELPNSYTSVKYSIESAVASVWIGSDTFHSTLSWVRSIAMWISIVLAFIAILVTMNYLFTSVSFKIREIGILKGLGSSSHEIFGIFVIEAMIIAAVNFVASCLVAWGVSTVVDSLFKGMFGISLTIITFGWIPALVLFGTSFVISIISVLIPSYTASSMKPADAMKRGAD